MLVVGFLPAPLCAHVFDGPHGVPLPQVRTPTFVVWDWMISWNLVRAARSQPPPLSFMTLVSLPRHGGLTVPSLFLCAFCPLFLPPAGLGGPVECPTRSWCRRPDGRGGENCWTCRPAGRKTWHRKNCHRYGWVLVEVWCGVGRSVVLLVVVWCCW